MEQIIYLLYRTTNIIGTAQHNFLGDSAIIIVIYPDAVPCRCSSCRSGARPRLCRTSIIKNDDDDGGGDDNHQWRLQSLGSGSRGGDDQG